MFTLLSSAAWAQQTASGIAGTVRDTSGAVLPGVTVEAASPALIEKVRTVVTNDEGRYNIVDLRPGTYVVTFTLPGFSTVKREGIELTAGFTATVNGDLQVGALEETITVSGATPLVDTQNVRKQTVMSTDLLDTLPMSTKNVNTVATITPGFDTSLNAGGRRRLYHAGRRRHLSRQGRQQRHVRRHGDSACRRQHGLHAEHRPYRRSDAVDQRHLGREQRRWRRGEHGSQGGRQHASGGTPPACSAAASCR